MVASLLGLGFLIHRGCLACSMVSVQYFPLEVGAVSQPTRFSMFLDHLGQSVIEGSVILDRFYNQLHLIVEMEIIGGDWVSCSGFVLESEDMNDFDLCDKTRFCTALQGYVIRECEVLYGL